MASNWPIPFVLVLILSSLLSVASAFLSAPYQVKIYRLHQHQPSASLFATFVTMPSSDSEEEFQPKAKKVKPSKAEEEEEDDDAQKEEVNRDKDGNAYFDLASKKKRCTVKKWKKMVLVDIREVSLTSDDPFIFI